MCGFISCTANRNDQGLMRERKGDREGEYGKGQLATPFFPSKFFASTLYNMFHLAVYSLIMIM